jgi:uncharacterized membrane protein YkvA (DUF1232 family)
VVEAARREVARLRSTARSPFIVERIDRVERLAAMIQDDEWQLPEEGRRRVLAALAYVGEAHDLVPDGVPVLGLLDDAIMLELLLRELQPELDSYSEFDAYRREQEPERRPDDHHAVSRQDWLDSRREALHERVRERRERALEACGGTLGLITSL